MPTVLLCGTSPLAIPAMSVPVGIVNVFRRMRGAIGSFWVACNSGAELSLGPVRIDCRLQYGSAQWRRAGISAFAQLSSSIVCVLSHHANRNGGRCCPALLVLYLCRGVGCLPAQNMDCRNFFSSSLSMPVQPQLLLIWWALRVAAPPIPLWLLSCSLLLRLRVCCSRHCCARWWRASPLCRSWIAVCRTNSPASVCRFARTWLCDSRWPSAIIPVWVQETPNASFCAHYPGPVVQAGV